MEQTVHLLRRDLSRNMARFYRLELCRTLFGELVLIQRWGRIGTTGKQSEIIVPDRHAGKVALSRWTRKKLARGYRIDDS